MPQKVLSRIISSMCKEQPEKCKFLRLGGYKIGLVEVIERLNLISPVCKIVPKYP